MAIVMEAIETYARENPKKSSEHNTLSHTHSELPTREQIAILAYHFWHERGCPDGSPEVDWFRAELHLQSVNEHSSNTLTLASLPVLDLPH
jgi:hypothetical protein